MTSPDRGPTSEVNTTQIADQFNKERKNRLKGWNRLMWGGFLGGLGIAGVAAILATGGLAAPWVINTLFSISSVGVSLGTVGAGGGIAEIIAQRRSKK